MAISWTPRQLEQVVDLIEAHPARIGRCADLARRILPIARDVDPRAHGVVIRPLPGRGWFVEPRIGGTMWRHHVTVAAEMHVVDALTGAAGMERERYREAHWVHADDLSFKPDDLEDPCL